MPAAVHRADGSPNLDKPLGERFGFNTEDKTGQRGQGSKSEETIRERRQVGNSRNIRGGAGEGALFI